VCLQREKETDAAEAQAIPSRRCHWLKRNTFVVDEKTETKQIVKGRDRLKRI